MRDATHATSSINYHRAADDDHVTVIPCPSSGHHRRLSSGRLSNVPSSGSLHSLLPPHRGRRRTCRYLLIALATVLGLQLLAHALFPVTSPLPAIAEGITSLSHSAALLAHSTHHLWMDTHPMLAHDAHLVTTAIPRTIYLVGSTPHPRGASEPACALLGNGGWTVQRYTEAQAAAFVHREFPQHDPLFRSLASWPAQRTAVFRLLVLLRHGGVTLGPGLDCHRDLDAIVATDGMVVGWDANGRTVSDHLMAAPSGHPVLRDVMQRLSTMAAQKRSLFEPQTLWEQWTAAVLAHAASNLADKWGVRVLPAAVLGPGPDGLLVASAEPTAPRGWCALLPSAWRAGVTACGHDTPHPSAVLHESTAALLRPVTIPWQPPFSLLLPPAGVGHYEDEISRQLLRTGSWQPGQSLHQQGPHPLSTLLDALGAAAQQGEASLLLDVGAGHGLASGAAAARGHAVVAVEPCSAMRGALQATARQQEMRSQLAVVEGECVGLSADVCLCGNGVLRSTACEPSLSAVLPLNASLTAVRVHVPCHEGAVLRALTPLVAEHNPRVVHVELGCEQARAAVDEELVAALHGLRAAGMEGIVHTGRVCDARWDGLAASAGLGVGGTNTHRPTWCRLDWGHVGALAGTLQDVETVVLERAEVGAEHHEAWMSAAAPGPVGVGHLE